MAAWPTVGTMTFPIETEGPGPERPLALLHRALNVGLGIIIKTPDPERFRAALYRARATDPDLAILSILTSPTNPSGELWILRKSETGTS